MRVVGRVCLISQPCLTSRMAAVADGQPAPGNPAGASPSPGKLHPEVVVSHLREL